MALKKGIFILGAKRTAFGAFGGTFKDTSSTELAVYACRAAIENANVKPEAIDSVFVGNVIQSDKGAAYIARHVALKCGVPIPAPALTVNRLCGSGFQSVICAAQEIKLGLHSLALAAGTENMSMAPYASSTMRFGPKLGQNYELVDMLWAGLSDPYCDISMGITAENLAEKYGITREMADKLALRSQINWKKAQDAGIYKLEIVSVKAKGKTGEFAFEVDEHPKVKTTMDDLTKLKPVFKKNGVVTAGNASGIGDGAAAVVISSEEYTNKHNLKPLARIAAWAVVGVEPTIMGIGPVPAIRKVLKDTQLTLDDIGIIEINEAFAAQAAAVQKELKIPDEKLNECGGAIAISHPLGASGSRITVHLAQEISRRGIRYGIGAACIGGGQGIALLLEGCE